MTEVAAPAGAAEDPAAAERLKGNLGLSAAFVAVFCLFYGGADLIGAQAATRYRIAFEFEAALPFRPELAVVYLSVTPLLVLALFVFPRPRELFPLAALLSLQVVVSAIVFVLLPVQEIFPPTKVDGPWAPVFNLADFLNLRHNDLPALHVSLSLSAALAYRRRLGGVLGIGLVLWAAAIALSAWFTHQHHLADIVAGALLAVVMTAGLYPRLQRPSVVEAASLEWYCLSAFITFARRHRRYLVIALALYWRALLGWRRSRVLRVGFCFLQIVDDLLDGDRPASREPADIAAELLGQITHRDFTAEPVSRLAKALVEDLEILRTAEDDPVADLTDLVAHMIVDRIRARDGILLHADALRDHHRKTFRLSLNLLLVASRAELRAGDARDLIEALGWCSTMRDLREDLEHGLNNIPVEILAAAEQQGAGPEDPGRLVDTRAMRSWLAAELERARDHLRQCAAALTEQRGRRGVRTLAMFHRSILRFARRFNRQYGLGLDLP